MYRGSVASAKVHQPAGDEEPVDDHYIKHDKDIVDNKIHAETVEFSLTLLFCFSNPRPITFDTGWPLKSAEKDQLYII